MRLLLAQRPNDFLPYESVKSSFEFYQGKPLDLPADGIPPDGAFPARHRVRFESLIPCIGSAMGRPKSGVWKLPKPMAGSEQNPPTAVILLVPHQVPAHLRPRLLLAWA